MNSPITSLNPRPVFFDFDGVIADSERVWYAACCDAYAPLGHVIDEQEYYTYWAGGGDGPAGESLRHGLNMTPEQCTQVNIVRKQAYAERVDAGEVRLFPGSAEMIRAADRRGQCAIASNSPRDRILSILRKSGITLQQTPVIGASIQHLPKPAPDLFLAAAHTLGVEAATAIVIEDTYKGVLAAKAAGIPVLLVRNQTNQHVNASLVDGVVTRQWITDQLS
jgi:HAD superfamily hydrolase (TIGR01509 family)